MPMCLGTKSGEDRWQWRKRSLNIFGSFLERMSVSGLGNLA